MQPCEIPQEIDRDIRCRTLLKPYVNHQILAIGYLSRVSQNRGLEEHLQKHHNALLNDVHVIQDLTTNEKIYLNFDHVHCAIGNLKLKQYQGKYVMISAGVVSYQAQGETRYGFNDTDIEPQSKATLRRLNLKYKDHLSDGQITILQTAYKMVKAASILKIAPFEEVNRRLIKSNSMTNRTSFLDSVIDKLYHGQALPARQSIKFKSNAQIAEEKPTIEVDKTIFNQMQTQNKLLTKRNKELEHLNRDQANLIAHQKPASLWQALKLYFGQRHVVATHQPEPKKTATKSVQKESENHVTNDQLAKLQKKFNK